MYINAFQLQVHLQVSTDIFWQKVALQKQMHKIFSFYDKHLTQ